MNYLAPLLFAGILVLLAGSAFLWVWWRDRKAMKEFARRYKEAEKGPYWLAPDGKVMQDGQVVYSPTDSIDSPQP